MNQSLSYEFAAVVPAVRATGITPSLCTIQQPDGNLIDAGQPSGNFVNVPGLVNLVCMSAPMSEARLQATDVRALEDIQSFVPHHVWLAGYYPQIQSYAENGAQAVIDGKTYLLLGAETDSQMQTTRLSIRETSV